MCSIYFSSVYLKKTEFQQYFDTQKGRKSAKETVRFGTPPAEQAQVDWKENIKYVTKDGKISYVNICVFLLAYSRFRTYFLSISKSLSVLMSFLMESFKAIGGVPKTLLVDNMKTIMDEPRTAYQSGKINERFNQFAKDCGFEVKACIAGRPQNKAKAEAPMKLLDEIHAYQGKFDYEELHAYIQKLCNRINSVSSGDMENSNFTFTKRKKSPIPTTKQENKRFL